MTAKQLMQKQQQGASMSASQITATIQQVAMAALNHSIVLVPEWLPDGRRIKSEWLAKNPARGDRQVGSFSVSLLTGKWHDFADNAAKGGDLVKCQTSVIY